MSGQLWAFPARSGQYGPNESKVLGSRGWILQEQILSTRILGYGNELRWMCFSSEVSERDPVPMSDELHVHRRAIRTFKEKLITSNTDTRILTVNQSTGVVLIVQELCPCKFTNPTRQAAVWGISSALEGPYRHKHVAEFGHLQESGSRPPLVSHRLLST